MCWKARQVRVSVRVRVTVWVRVRVTVTVTVTVWVVVSWMRWRARQVLLQYQNAVNECTLSSST